jgi:hypothetical protein
MKARKSARVALLSAASLLLGATTVYAATATVTSSIRFLTHITITENQAPNFGNVASLTAGTYVLNTADVVTPSGGGIVEGGITKSGDYTVVASTNQGINIYAGGYTASGASTPSAATCKYDTGSAVSCGTSGSPLQISSPLASATLKVGLTVTTTNAGADNQTDSPSFNLNVVYQ